MWRFFQSINKRTIKDNFIVLNGLYRQFLFIIDEAESIKGSDIVNITALDISNIFDRKVIEKNTQQMTTNSIEEFIAETYAKLVEGEKLASIKLNFKDALKDFIQTKTLSATQLKLFYFCPRIWLFKEKMKLQEKDSAATLVNQFLTGDIYHRILELFFGKLKEKNLRIHLENDELSSEYETYLQESYSTAIQEKAECYLTKELFNTTTEEMYSTIKNAVIAFSKPFNEYWVVGTEIQLAFDNLVGKPDCLLQSPEKEEYILVDFKSSKNGIPEAKNKYYNEEHPENIPDFQIPLYVYLLKNNTNYKSLDVENACFYNIHECCFEYVFGENLISTLHKTRTTPVSAEEFSFTVNKCLELKDKMIESIQNYDFTLNPSIQTFEQCFGCKYKSICRKTFKIRGSK